MAAAVALAFLPIAGVGRESPGERERERQAMVEEQIASRGVDDPATLAAMRKVPRHLFVPAQYSEYAYADTALPIGHGQTISQPFIVAYTTETARLRPGSKVLDIGTGSGYQAAIAAEIAGKVFSIEIVPELADRARNTLRQAGYERVQVRAGDGYLGWPEEAPFDVIIVAAAPENIPPPLIGQLKDGGRMIIPLGPDGGAQELTLVTKQKGKVRTRKLMPVGFVPFTRESAPVDTPGSKAPSPR